MGSMQGERFAAKVSEHLVACSESSRKAGRQQNPGDILGLNRDRLSISSDSWA
jgi:hypothetical protein